MRAMKTFNTYFTNQENLQEYIAINSIVDSSSLLIQIFSCVYEEEYIAYVVGTLTNLLPHAIIIGSTSDGAIKDGLVSKESIVLSFTQFSATALKLFVVDHVQDYFEAGAQMAQKLIAATTKVLITFVSGSLGCGDSYLKGIASIHSNVVVAGGLASDTVGHNKSFVLAQEQIIFYGAVGVALDNAHLHLYKNHAHHWIPIGLEMTISKCQDNRLYQIDNRTALETYRYYLGENIATRLPAFGIAFPIIIKREGLHIIRNVITKHKDGSLSFAGNLQKGDKIQFGYGDSNSIISASNRLIDILGNRPIESIFLYSSKSRKEFLDEKIEYETLPFGSIAPTSGFFGNGEFFSFAAPELLNSTLTILALSESDNVRAFCKHEDWHDHSIQDEKIKALTHIAKVTATDTQYKNDRQTQIYSRLHTIGKRLNATTDISLLYDMACEFATDELKFEKCIIFTYDHTNQWFKAIRSIGYENDRTQKMILDDITLLLLGRVIETLRINKKPIIHTSNSPCDDVASLVRSLFLEEVYMELFGGDIENVPHGVIVVGNSTQNRHLYTQMGVDALALLALGNFTVQLSNTVDNIIYYQALIEEKELLQERVESRTREIKRQKESFEAIYKTSKDGIAIINRHTYMFLDANGAYIEMIGYTKEELLERSCSGLMLEGEESDGVLKEIALKGFVTNYIKTCKAKGGNNVIVNMSIALMNDNERLLISAKDITIQKEHERQMAQMHQYTKDSIEYAAMIQHSILSNQNELQEHFEDSFMIWKPKDIVGGDIVFIQALNKEEIVVMVIDCTGHGVHGAFVTMLVKGIERHIMAEILYKKESVSTAHILHKFNKRMKMLLNHENSDKTSSHAGFDGGILYYNTKDKIIKYSGAQIPLFIVQEGKCTILKGDKHSIGYLKSDAHYRFKEYSCDVSKGATVYLSSDGYLDQIGGEKRFMFGRNRFQRVLETHWQKPLEMQKNILIDTFYQYKQGEERKDDLTVVGLKIL